MRTPDPSRSGRLPLVRPWILHEIKPSLASASRGGTCMHTDSIHAVLLICGSDKKDVNGPVLGIAISG